MKVQIEANASKEDVQQIRDGLESFNRLHAKSSEWIALNVFVRDDAGKIQGGLLGGTFWDWCHIDILWLDDSIRGERIGSKLLELAEAEAKKRGCFGIFVDTMSFQAPDFYRKHGYTQWGQLDDFPPEHQRLFFKKQF